MGIFAIGLAAALLTLATATVWLWGFFKLFSWELRTAFAQDEPNVQQPSADSTD